MTTHLYESDTVLSVAASEYAPMSNCRLTEYPDTPFTGNHGICGDGEGQVYSAVV